MNTKFRKVVKNDSEEEYFKLMNKAVFGETVENFRDRIEIKTTFDAKYLQHMFPNPSFTVVKCL